MGARKFYITTAIDYVNSLPHIGTAYEKIGADVLARWHRLLGEDVHFQMGNDEHSVGVQRAALARGLSPEAYCAEMSARFEGIWRGLDISCDDFIRTSEPRHAAGVQRFFALMMEAGDIYKKPYEGWYCEPCEAFLTEKDLVGGLCPNHKSKPKWLSEENYFFALSRYRDRLIEHISKHPEFILPEIRRNEVLSLLKEGLEDISVSRSSFDWGIPVPGDPAHVVYVWLDALVNYITAAGYGTDDARFARLWPAEMHVIGKDITRFHCVMWPAMLMSARLPLPRTVFGHGFVYLKGEKMSKTLGNVVTPMDIVGRFGPDPLRYYLMREGGFGHDSDFTWDHFIERYNGDLANGIGNLVSRTAGMARRYQGGRIEPVEGADRSTPLARAAEALPGRVERALDHATGEVEFHNALAAIWEVMATADRHINENKPWEMHKGGKADEINRVLWEVASALRTIAILLSPFMPRTAAAIWKALGLEATGAIEKQGIADASAEWGSLTKPISVAAEAALFPRIEAESGGKGAPAAELKADADKDTDKEGGGKMEAGDKAQQIDISDFSKLDLRVAEVLEAGRIEGADKLLKLRIGLGDEERQIVAGIAKHYSAEELVGKSIVVVANLKPTKLKGVESQGMLLAASDSETVSILVPLKGVKPGSKVK